MWVLVSSPMTILYLLPTFVESSVTGQSDFMDEASLNCNVSVSPLFNSTVGFGITGISDTSTHSQPISCPYSSYLFLCSHVVLSASEYTVSPSQSVSHPAVSLTTGMLPISASTGYFVGGKVLSVAMTTAYDGCTVSSTGIAATTLYHPESKTVCMDCPTSVAWVSLYSGYSLAMLISCFG